MIMLSGTTATPAPTPTSAISDKARPSRNRGGRSRGAARQRAREGP
ncbi:hypothetical protein [Actinacidiphila yeochonensis]|nr:hypothetical protein [Actinacidiphila yeochonensis]